MVLLGPSKCKCSHPLSPSNNNRINLPENVCFCFSFNCASTMLLDKYLIHGHKWLSTCQKSNSIATCRPFIRNTTHSTIYKASLSRLLCVDHRNYSTHTRRHWKELMATTSQYENTFSVMSYNILAQNYVDSQPSLYVGHDAKSLQWPHRFKALKQEIGDIDPDILCLQEVQQNHLDDIIAYFRGLGYVTSLYKKRTGLQVDGCAIFYKQHLFDLIECHFVDYFQPGIKVFFYLLFFPDWRQGFVWPCMMRYFSIFFQILNRCNVAVIGRLALKSQPHKQFVVSTTHLLFNPKRQDVRLAQIQVLLAELDRIARNDDQFHRMVPIILTGDFNVQQHSDEFRLLIGEKVYPLRLLNRMNFLPKNHKQFLPQALGISDNCQHFHVIANQNRYETAVSWLFVVAIDRLSHRCTSSSFRFCYTATSNHPKYEFQ